jgi:hypothetical protein
MACDIQIQLADLGDELLVALGLFGLALEPVHLGLHLQHDVGEAVKIVLGALHLAQGDFFLVFIAGDAGGFLHPQAALLGPGLDKGRNPALLNDGIGPVAQAGVHQKLLDVL